MTTKIVCKDCGTTGLYQGFMEKPGEPRICWKCEGLGYVEAEVFSGRKHKENVKAVKTETGVISYEQFKERYR